MSNFLSSTVKNLIFVIFWFISGAKIGSLLNVIACRVPIGNPLHPPVLTAIRRFVSVIMSQFWDGFGCMVGVEIALPRYEFGVL